MRLQLAQDLGEKARFYAAHGIADYWVVDLLNQNLILHRDPTESEYRSVTEQPWTQSARPLIAPDTGLILADLLAD